MDGPCRVGRFFFGRKKKYLPSSTRLQKPPVPAERASDLRCLYVKGDAAAINTLGGVPPKPFREPASWR